MRNSLSLSHNLGQGRCRGHAGSGSAFSAVSIDFYMGSFRRPRGVAPAAGFADGLLRGHSDRSVFPGSQYLQHTAVTRQRTGITNILIKAREFAAAADADADGLRGLVASWMWKLAVAGIVVLGGGCFVVSGGFGLLFGSRWAEAGIFMFALLPISLARFVVVPVMPVLIVFERQVLQLLWQSGLALLTFVGYSVLGFITGPVMVVACVGVLCASWYAVLALGILRHGGRGKMLFDQGTDETRWSRE